MKWKAHAKLNLALNITGRRRDGYHLIDTVFQEISLYDDIDIRGADRIDVDCPGIDPEHNIVWPAVHAFFEATGIEGGARIRIDKHIPSGAGLGGGSSDAAAVLCALNQMYGHPLQPPELLRVGVRLGADVPACIQGGTQRARGIGEVLTTISNRCRFKFLLVKPEQSISTKDAYDLYDRLPQTRVDIGQVARALERADDAAYRRAAGNALLPPALTLVPEIAQAGRDCLSLGAAFWMLTGSGSCIFSIFDTKDLRDRARAELVHRYPFVEAADPCPGPSLHSS